MLFKYKYFKEVYFAVFLLAVVATFGTVGFMLVEGYTFAEGFYMTIITVSTVGFREVKPLSNDGRIFTSILIISSFGTFAYAASSITKYLVTGQYRNYFKYYRVNQELNKLSNHVIICGYGRNGTQAAKTLDAYETPYVIIESNPDMVRELSLQGKIYLEGDASDELNLEKAGVNRAKALITTLPKDALNLFVVLTAREMNKSLMIISRASEPSSEKKLRIAGADNVIMPDRVGGSHMATLVVTPDVIEFLDKLSVAGLDKTNLEEIYLKTVSDSLAGKSIKEIELSFKTGVRIIGIKEGTNEYIINPDSNFELKQGLKLFVLGTRIQIEHLKASLLS